MATENRPWEAYGMTPGAYRDMMRQRNTAIAAEQAAAQQDDVISNTNVISNSSGLMELMQKFPHLFGSYAQSYQGPTRKALQRMDPTYGNWTGQGATHSLPQYNALKEQWQQQQADRMTEIEDYYGFSPTDEQRQSLIANVGPQLNKQYYTMPGSSRPRWLDNRADGLVGQNFQHELDTAAAHATSSLDKWLPGQEGLFDALYNYEPPLRNEQISNKQTDSGQPIEGFTRPDIGEGANTELPEDYYVGWSPDGSHYMYGNKGLNVVRPGPDEIIAKEDPGPHVSGGADDMFTRSRRFTGPRTLEEIRDYATKGGYSQMENILKG